MKRRRRYLVKRGMQFRYLGLVLISIVLPTLLVGACLYWLIFTIMAQQLALPESIAYILFPVIKRINGILIIGLPITLVVLVGWGLILSHRIAGPVYRLEKELDRIAKGAPPVRLKLRRKDELRSLVDCLNRVFERIEGGRGQFSTQKK